MAFFISFLRRTQLKAYWCHFVYHYVVQGVGGSELIRKGLLEEADFILNLKA